MEVSFIPFLSHLNDFFTFFCVFPAILLLGIYLTWQLRGIQVSKLKLSFSYLFKKEAKGEGTISHYQAISSVLAGNFGTGNISGMAIALAVGGPGALVWMWVLAFFGAVIQYASCVLGVKYRQRNKDGEFVGGPMYYLTKGLKLKFLGVLFSLVLILASFSVGNFVQVNSMVLPLAQYGISKWVAGIGIAFFVSLVILGGVKRVAKVASAIVPLMAILYIGTAWIILAMHGDKLLPAFASIFSAAFHGGSFLGGFLGFAVFKALTTGFDRAIFATDAGTGTVPILQSNAKTSHPAVNGVVSLIAPFLVMIVCTTTALTLIVTDAGYSNLESTNLVAFAFQRGVGNFWGPFVVTVSLLLFGYTTTLAWASCMERGVAFLWGKAAVRPFQYLFILLVPLGAVLHVGLVWALADICLTFLLILNLIGIIGLSREVIEETRSYFSPLPANQPELEIEN